MKEVNLKPDPDIRVRDYRIGCIGAGMIMAECHLAAYSSAGFAVSAIASRTKSRAQEVAQRWSIPVVHNTWQELIADENVTVLDIAFPPDQQPEIIRAALNAPHIKGILAQKPLALTLEDAIALRDEAIAAGKILSVNQNMRYDQSIRIAKQLIEENILGNLVFGQINMHAIPHWQGFLEEYDRLTLANMSVHHLDALRFLFGDVEEVTSLTRADPRTEFDHTDGIVSTTLKFKSGVMAHSLEDVWSGPREDGFDDDQQITWRIEGNDGIAKGTIGWPTGTASTIQYASKTATEGKWVAPKWKTMWFPDAFVGVMEQLQYAIKTGTPPALDVADNVKTMALVEAAYKSIDEKRTVRLSELSINN